MIETFQPEGLEAELRREDAVARRAYEISLTPESGSDVENWLRAEQEIDGAGPAQLDG